MKTTIIIPNHNVEAAIERIEQDLLIQSNELIIREHDFLTTIIVEDTDFYIQSELFQIQEDLS